MHLSPGNAASNLVNANDALSLQQSQKNAAAIAFWQHRLGLDLPLFYFSINSLGNQSVSYWIPVVHFQLNNQFHRWLFGDGIFSNGVLHGDFGISYTTRQPVTQLLQGRIKWSAGLAMAAMLFSVLISIPIAFHAANHKGKLFDKIVQGVSLVFIALPVFWLATLLLAVLANPSVLHMLPASGTGPISSTATSGNWMESLPYLILPFICYTIGTTGFLLRSIRDMAIRELDEDYARTAFSKGQTRKRILFVHVLKNILPSLITLAAFAFPAAISGSVIVEYIFAIPGMGSLLQQAVLNLDYPVISAVFLISAVLTISGFIFSDLINAWLDPRRKKGVIV